MSNNEPKFGVRIYPLDSGVILIKQTVKKVGSGTYVIDILPDGSHREAHVALDDTNGIAESVRQALKGVLRE